MTALFFAVGLAAGALEAVSLARASRLDPRYLKVYLDTYGVALLRNGKAAEAERVALLG